MSCEFSIGHSSGECLPGFVDFFNMLTGRRPTVVCFYGFVFYFSKAFSGLDAAFSFLWGRGGAFLARLDPF